MPRDQRENYQKNESVKTEVKISLVAYPAKLHTFASLTKWQKGEVQLCLPTSL